MILAALDSGKIEEVKLHYDKEFRVHHFYKEGDKEVSYLTKLLVEDKSNVLNSNYLTVSEEALLEKNGDKTNYQLLFANAAYLKKLSENYKDYGFEVKNKDLHAAFNSAEQASSDKETFKNLRIAFSFPEADKKPEDEPKKVDKVEKTSDSKPVEKKDENVQPPVQEGDGQKKDGVVEEDK